jgi:hypothetical protein
MICSVVNDDQARLLAALRFDDFLARIIPKLDYRPPDEDTDP